MTPFDLVQKQLQNQLKLVITDFVTQFVDTVPVQHGHPPTESRDLRNSEPVYIRLILKMV